jgi:hypothetical protein
LTQNCNQNFFVSDCENLETLNVTSGQRVRSIPVDNSIYLATINDTLIGDVYSGEDLSIQIALYDTTSGEMMGSLNELVDYLYVMIEFVNEIVDEFVRFDGSLWLSFI